MLTEIVSWGLLGLDPAIRSMIPEFCLPVANEELGLMVQLPNKSLARENIVD